ncbi:pyruvate dehydrogenase (lipoamide) [Providencia manganoxydans]|uniref:transketolase-like TK C-terminal-containing protein n=1 Tax=Providencia manganoxydans TaxID=2923283 RepID=UPI0034DCE286
MLTQYFKMPSTTVKTRQAVQACINQIDLYKQYVLKIQTSPDCYINNIRQLLSKLDTLWMVSGDESKQGQTNKLKTAWPLWFQNKVGSYEKPLFYFLHSNTISTLLSLEVETNRKGIFFNSADKSNIELPKGVQAWFPLILSTMKNWLPFDPANAQETAAIMQQALKTIYLDGEQKMVYIATHEQVSEFSPMTNSDIVDAYKGMYQISTPEKRHKNLVVRLCGAGKSLERVKKAAHLLKHHWDIECEVWSCPSYTRLAYDAEQLTYNRQQNVQNPLVKSHIERCFGKEDWSVIAVTDYNYLIASQIKPFVTAKFTAIGSDPQIHGEASYPQPEWIALCALKRLVEQHKLSTDILENAIHLLGIENN